MHDRQKLRLELREFANGWRRCRSKTRLMEKVFGCHSRLNNVAAGECRRIAAVGEQVSAEQSVGRLLEDNARIPAVGDMRRVDVPQALAADIDNLSIRQYAGRTVCHIGDGYTTADHSVRKLRLRRRRQI